MSNYIRYKELGGTYFFTVNLLQRQNNPLLVEHIQQLKQAIRIVKAKYPFQIHAWVILPDHMHCIWQLPPNDDDFSNRWRLIKSYFSKMIGGFEQVSLSREKRKERSIWQRRFWEHYIRDDADFTAHMDYIHFNPVKHGHVKCVKDWPYSTFHHWVKQGVYDEHWGGGIELLEMEFD